MKGRLLVFFLFLPFFVRSQVIITYGGGGVTPCEGCPATTSYIIDPTGGTFDKTGNYYFTSCLGGNKVYKISNTGIITTIAGTGVGGFSGDGGLATAAKLMSPSTAKLDAAGNIYIADFGNHKIRKINISTGIITTIAGVGSSGYNGEGIPATDAKFDVNDICIDKLGNIYFADYNARRVRKINTAGNISTIAGTGVVGSSGDGGPATAAELNPNGIVMDESGGIYIPDPYANLVRKINTVGIISTIAGVGNTWAYAGVDGIPATNASIQPAHLAIDKMGNLYIGDGFNKRVFKVNASGILYHVAGNGITGFSGDGGAATVASLDYPSGVSTDSCGNLYITEANNRRIRKVTFNPAPCTYLNVNKIQQIALSIYPNPVNDELHIDGVQVYSSYRMVNAIGTVIQQGVLKKGSNTVSMATLASGVYLLQIEDEETKEKITKRVVKQ